MLYLAEVVQKRGLMGSKSELKLLACQKGEQWSAITNEDPIASDDASNYKDGALVLVDAIGSGADRKVKNIQEGARQIVSLLQSYSRQQEKNKSQEEEIQQWMESLTYQSQELNRREQELDERREKLEQLEQELRQLDRQRQEVQQARESADRLNQEVQHKRQEIEQAQHALRAQQEQLNQERLAMQQQLAQSAGLDAQQAAQLQHLLQQAASSVVAMDYLQSAVETCLQITAAQESLLNHAPAAEPTLSPEVRDWITSETQTLAAAWQDWYAQRDDLDRARAEWRAQQTALELHQQQLSAVEGQLATQRSLQTLLEQAANGDGHSDAAQRVDRAALEAMPIGELQELTAQLQRDLEKLSRLVSDEEEELSAKRQAIEELQGQINSANEYDRIQLETNLADERDGCQMLEETLVGQRRNLQEREEVLHAHKTVLNKRQGLTAPRTEGGVDLSPLLDRVTQDIQALEELQSQLRDRISTLESTVQEAEMTVNQRHGDVQAQLQILQDRERELQSKQIEAITQGSQGGDTLTQPMSEQVSGLRQHLEALLTNLTQATDTTQAQQATIGQMQQIVASLSK
ncbi:pilus motility taxis protein HmpF [Limnothrix sp. PR1529]|uniref:pilus motility taxis protein HmpF n=1 Tax=Limnothrix sp. PR1529 TaxID=1704291 RepID=UPI00081D68B5|nr:pilus motility taxis protein HmpF [Limnothrix sp. PR1529]OCQ89224.1 hypothetical protein BCR12_00880 [Limnothrix sp. P13C2]